MNYKHFIFFVAGAASGSLATCFLLKRKYEETMQTEIESVKEAFSRRALDREATLAERDFNAEKAATNHNKPDICDYAKKLADEGYFDYSNPDTSEEQPEPEPEKKELNAEAKPYVISPDQFREFDDYDVITFMYYADHILADDDDQPVEDVEGTVGFESLGHFGEYDDDSVYVRNDRLKIDYEILRSLKTYSEVLESKPYLKED